MLGVDQKWVLYNPGTAKNLLIAFDRKEPAPIIILLGKTGAGKSSIVESVTSTTGRSGNTHDPGITLPITFCDISWLTNN